MVTTDFILLSTFIDAYCRWLSDLSLDLGAVINDLSPAVGKYNFGQLHKLSFDLKLFVTMKTRLIEDGQLHTREHFFLMRNWSKILRQLNMESKLDK